MADETGKDNPFDAIPDRIKNTLITEKVGDTAVEVVDPKKVELLVNTLIKLGVTEINWKDGLRRLDPELARVFAEAARDILLLTVKEFGNNRIPIERAMNWGSTIDGIVVPDSDVDVKLDLLTEADLEAAGKLFRFNEGFRENLLRISNHRISKIEYLLTVPSMYAANPGEKWIPKAHDIVKIEIPNR